MNMTRGPMESHSNSGNQLQGLGNKVRVREALSSVLYVSHLITL